MRGKGGYASAPDADGFEDLLEWVAAAVEGEEGLARFVDRLSSPVRRRVRDSFGWQAHGGQREPGGSAAGSGTGSATGLAGPDWRVWAIIAGRGFGKTRAGAEWVSARAREGAVRIALVGASRDEVEKVMIEGPSGLLAVARCGEAPCWLPSRGLVLFPSGAEAHVYAAEAAEKLRGPQHHYAWADELAKWRHADAAWDNLMLGLREGERPRAVVTTTPKAVAIVRRVLAEPGTVETRGRTAENVHLPASYRAAVTALYAGTRLGRQELDGELLEDAAGTLWPREVLERARGQAPAEAMKRVVVGVDPPASAQGDACGIVVCGLGPDGRLWVLADASVEGMRPEGWARAVAEKNQGGDMVESVLRSAGAWLPVRGVSASKGKTARAEPVAALFEAGKAGLAGCFPRLEDEMAGLTAGGGYEGPGRSPDRADAMVWAMTELMQPVPEPRIRRL
jgi:phage terminase large subunit-like protein